MNQICIFEDEAIDKLYPLTLTRPVYELRCGIKTLREKIIDLYPKAEIVLHCRSYLENVLKEKTSVAINKLAPETTLFINGRAFADFKLSKEIPLKGKDAVYIKGTTVVAARVDKKNMKNFKLPELFSKKHFKGKEISVDVATISYFWDLLRLNADTISRDSIDTLLLGKAHSPIGEHVMIENKEHVFIGNDVVIKPGVVLDASHGPIFIDNSVEIQSHAVIIGPAYIGFKSVVKAGTRIYSGTTIGPVCKVAGEINNSIIQGYTNKAHDGFLGNSYLGEWINLGAGTENSNLKNNYQTVKVRINDKEINTATLFVGSVIGDFTRTSIKTMLNTGSVIGFCCNLYGSGFHDKYIPAFSWGTPEKYENYDYDKAISTAKAIMQRREVPFKPWHEKIFQKVFNLTTHERKNTKNRKK